MKRSLDVDCEELAERVQRIRLAQNADFVLIIAGGDAARQAAEGGGQEAAEGG
ncbi:hypothetical protein N9L19_01125 [bacterium]|nr:hypothetical protein [bacterium]